MRSLFFDPSGGTLYAELNGTLYEWDLQKNDGLNGGSGSSRMSASTKILFISHLYFIKITNKHSSKGIGKETMTAQDQTNKH